MHDEFAAAGDGGGGGGEEDEERKRKKKNKGKWEEIFLQGKRFQGIKGTKTSETFVHIACDTSVRSRAETVFPPFTGENQLGTPARMYTAGM